MARYLIEAGKPGYMWEGCPTYRISCRLETEASSKEEAIQKWHTSFSDEEKASINLETLKAFDVDTELTTHIPYYKEGRVLYFDGNNSSNSRRKES